MVGSLELLFNPTGLVSSVNAGMSDLYHLPLRGAPPYRQLTVRSPQPPLDPTELGVSTRAPAGSSLRGTVVFDSENILI
eukprot:1301441-Pyramimonas_sp.AAC.1